MVTAFSRSWACPFHDRIEFILHQIGAWRRLLARNKSILNSSAGDADVSRECGFSNTPREMRWRRWNPKRRSTRSRERALRETDLTSSTQTRRHILNEQLTGRGYGMIPRQKTPEQVERRADYLRAKVAKAQKELDQIAPSSARVDKDGLSVLIGVPTHNDLKHKTVLSVFGMLEKFRSSGIRYELEIIPGCPYIQLVRNCFANKAGFDADKSGRPYSHLLFVVADGAFSADDIFTLLKAEKPIAALPFLAKFINWNGAAKAARSSIAPAQLVEFAGNPIFSAESAFQVNTLSPVTRIGCGVMLIQTNLFRALAEAHPEWRYNVDRFGWGIAAVNPNRAQAYNFFQVGVCAETEQMYGEDYFFCDEARKVGFETYVLPQARTIHTGSHDFILNFSALASLGAMPQ